MRFIVCLIVLIVSCEANGVRAQSPWKLTEEKNGINVYRRPVANSRFDELKVTCRIEGTLSQLMAVLRDYSTHPEWVYGTRMAFRLTSVSATEEYFYTEVNTLWPFQNRDVVVHLTFSQDPVTKVVLIHANADPDYIPQKEDRVRIPYSKVTWRLTPLQGKSVDVDYQIHVDPGGSIPAWVVNSFLAKAPYESFSRLKEVVRQRKYDTSTVGTIAD